MKLLVKFAELGVYSIYSFAIFIFYTFFSNLNDIKEKTEGMTYFSFDIGALAGTAALAFTIHTSYSPCIKCNKK